MKKYICKYCGKEYFYNPKRVRNWKESFCSKNCAKQFKIKENTLKCYICKYCGKKFYCNITYGNWRKGNTQQTGRGGVSSKDFCSFECGMKYRDNKKKKTYLEHYGVINIFCKADIQQKAKAKAHSKETDQKRKATCIKKYGVDNPSQCTIIKQKKIQTCLKNHGCICGLQTTKARLKRKSEKCKIQEYITKTKNNSWNTSKPEENIFELLRLKFDIIRQYRSEKYPFCCDFYIPVLDLYIEYQGTWTHGGKPYEGTKEDLQIIHTWENKHTRYYSYAIDVWTRRDPLKREIAKKNKLNWIEFFTMNQFLNWYKEI